MFVSALAVRAGGLGLDPLALLLDVERAAAVTRSPNGDHSGRSSPCMCRGGDAGVTLSSCSGGTARLPCPSDEEVDGDAVVRGR